MPSSDGICMRSLTKATHCMFSPERDRAHPPHVRCGSEGIPPLGIPSPRPLRASDSRLLFFFALPQHSLKRSNSFPISFLPPNRNGFNSFVLATESSAPAARRPLPPRVWIVIFCGILPFLFPIAAPLMVAWWKKYLIYQRIDNFKTKLAILQFPPSV